VHMLHNCLWGETRQTAKVGVRDSDVLETQLMQGQKEPRHLPRPEDPVILIHREGGQTCREVDPERLVWFGGARVLHDIFSESCRSLDLRFVDLTAVRFRNEHGF